VLTRPSDRQLKRAKGPELLAELRALRDAAHVSLYFGPRTADAAAAALVLGAGNPVDPPPPLRYRSVAAPTIFFLHKDVAQARIDIVLPRGPQPAGDRPRAELLGHVLGGDMSGMAFQEIREARGLAYHAGAHLDLGDRVGDDAALIGSLGTQCDKAAGALGLMLELLRRPELAPDRVAVARLALLREYASERITPRSRPGWVQSWLDLGHPGDPRLGAAQIIRTVELEALQSYLAEFAGAAAIVSVLGDRRRVDLERLRALGEVQVVAPGALFPYAR
jgi:predicted Zn-dependent peptidase